MDGGKMTIPTLPEYVFPAKPVPQVTPFTYRDGVTMLKKLDGMVRYINRELVPFVNDNFSDLADDFETQVNILIAMVNAAIEEVINSSIVTQDPMVAQMIEDNDSQTHAALDTELASMIADVNTAIHNAIYLLGDARYAVYRQWNGTSYPPRIAGAVNLYVGPTDPGTLPASDFWLNPNFLTLNAGDARYTIYRVWNGTSYPARIANGVNIFIGPVNPGLMMQGNDIWANPDVTTLSAVTAAMLDTSSALYSATRKTVTSKDLLLFGSDSTVVGGVFGALPNEVYALTLPKGATPAVRFTTRIPTDLTSARLRAYWIAAGVGAARFEFKWHVVATDGSVLSYETTQTYASAGDLKVNEIAFSTPRVVTPGAFVTGTITRISTNPADTITGPVGIINGVLERA